MQSKATIAFTSALNNVASRIKLAKQAQGILKANRKQLGKLLRTLDRMGVENLHLSTDAYEKKPALYISMNNLDSFKDAKLVAVLEYLGLFSDKLESKDWPDYINRDYKFSSETIDVKVAAYVKSDSPTCRKVLVGTEQQTVEKFEIVCD